MRRFNDRMTSQRFLQLDDGPALAPLRFRTHRRVTDFAQPDIIFADDEIATRIAHPRRPVAAAAGLGEQHWAVIGDGLDEERLDRRSQPTQRTPTACVLLNGRAVADLRISFMRRQVGGDWDE